MNDKVKLYLHVRNGTRVAEARHLKWHVDLKHCRNMDV